jgi:hypothetical protein
MKRIFVIVRCGHYLHRQRKNCCNLPLELARATPNRRAIKKQETRSPRAAKHMSFWRFRNEFSPPVAMPPGLGKDYTMNRSGLAHKSTPSVTEKSIHSEYDVPRGSPVQSVLARSAQGATSPGRLFPFVASHQA